MARPTLIIGPPVNEMTREAAAKALEAHPRIVKGAEYDIQQHAGHWIAAISVPDEEEQEQEKSKAKSKTAGPPFGGGDEGGSEESAPPSDGGGDDSGSSSPPSDDGGSSDSDGPPKKKKPGGDEHLLHQLMQTVQSIAEALGIPAPGADAGGLGPDSLDGGPGGPPGMGAPPAGPPGAGAPPPPHGHGGPPGMGGPPPMPHEKPGPPPPATFASVDPRHPWAQMVGQVPHFVVAEQIGNDKYEDVEHELQTIARAGGFRIARFTPLVGQRGERAVQAVIETPRKR